LGWRLGWSGGCCTPGRRSVAGLMLASVVLAPERREIIPGPRKT